MEAKPASAVTQTSATFNGTVNPEGAEVSKCKVEYGPTTAYGSSVACSSPPDKRRLRIGPRHRLTANATYHFRMSAANSSGTTKGADATFKTLVNAPAVEAKPVSSLTQTSATLNGTVNPEGAEVSKCEVEYGPTTAYGSSVACSSPPGSGSSAVSVSAPVTGLTANATYHFRISATNSGGTSKGSDETFKALPNTPAVEPKAPSSLTQTSATLNGTVNPEGAEVSKCEVEYGTTTGYGSSVACSTLPGSGSSPVAVSASVTGLTPNTVYHFRVSVTNPGGTKKGPDETFKTPPNPTPTNSGAGTTNVGAKSGVLGSIAAAPPPPKFGVSGNLAPVSGSVLVKLPGSSLFVPLTSIRQIPFGTVVNATNGKVTVTTIGPTASSRRSPTHRESSSSPRTRTASSWRRSWAATSRCARPRRSAAISHARAPSTPRAKHVVRKLWSEGHGKYSTKGNYAAGAVLGTRWLTEDLCDGTLIHVVTDRVAVTNLVNHRHLTVKAGHSYLAKAP